MLKLTQDMLGVLLQSVIDHWERFDQEHEQVLENIFKWSSCSQKQQNEQQQQRRRRRRQLKEDLPPDTHTEHEEHHQQQKLHPSVHSVTSSNQNNIIDPSFFFSPAIPNNKNSNYATTTAVSKTKEEKRVEQVVPPSSTGKPVYPTSTISRMDSTSTPVFDDYEQKGKESEDAYYKRMVLSMDPGVSPTSTAVTTHTSNTAPMGTTTRRGTPFSFSLSSSSSSLLLSTTSSKTMTAANQNESILTKSVGSKSTVSVVESRSNGHNKRRTFEC